MTASPSRLVLLGHPVHHSLSPLFQNAALRAARIPLRYEAIDVAPAQLGATVALLKREGAAGNATIPHKEALASLCDSLTPLAERVGAVNTFRVRYDGLIAGDNTDVGGFEYLVRRTLGAIPAGVRMALLGTGGAAAAVLAAAERWSGCRVRLHGRTGARAERLAARFDSVVDTVAGSLDEAVAEADLVVNATPVGLEGDGVPVPLELVPASAAIIDLAYRRGETPWVRQARSRGMRANDGLPMLVEQGALAFERWFRIPAPRQAMWDALEAD